MDLRHVLLGSTSTKYPYEGSGGGNFDRFRRNREERRQHGKKLLLDVSSLFPDVYRDNYISKDEEGVYIELISEAGYELSINSLDVQGCRLCNVRDDLDDRWRATIFILEKDREKFLKKLDVYINSEGTRNNSALFGNVAYAQLANLEQFWTSNMDSFPKQDESIWWEVWLSRKSIDRKELADFLQYCKTKKLQAKQGSIEFELVTVIAVKATYKELKGAVSLISCLSELRRVVDTSRFLLKQKPYEQVDWVDELKSRVEFSNQNNVSLLILDHGVNYNHPLLTEGISAENCISWSQDWPLHDAQNSHGTLQAGLAFYGDISKAILSDKKVEIQYDIESCRILAPNESNDKDLYGALTYYGVNKAEEDIGVINRVISMAITAGHDGVSGQPTSWSAGIDQMSFEGENRRLFVLSSGNIREQNEIDADYKNNVNKFTIEDPGQSWNALTVGAYTDKSEVVEEEYKNWETVALAGDICPTSRTSNVWGWKHNAPYKPDVVEEGGNLLVSPDGDITNADCVSLVTTADISNGHLFTDHRETSAANALVSRIAAEVWNGYPKFRAETVRALIAHSARWTKPMLAYQAEAISKGVAPKDAKEIMLRMFGYGVPNIQRSLASAKNYLTMVVENEIQPFSTKSSSIPFNEMHIVELPWPEKELLALGNANCRLRITLSYFIEPNPGRNGFTDKFRYQSFGLRFQLNNPDEDGDSFLIRINKAEKETRGLDYESESADASGWALGDQLRRRGSLHQDIWEGSASDLALRNYVGVLPVGGWWKQSKKKLFEDKSNVVVPYSLIISLEIDEDTDIYTPVATEVGIEPSVEILVPLG